jgi:phosphatidate cytidylyltransferase
MYKLETPKEHLKASFKTILACIYPTFFFGFMLMINHLDAIAGVKYFSLIIIVLIVAITMLTDTFAYLVGSKLRGPKLCPKISPNKTISGAIGGLIGGVIGAMLVFWLANAKIFSGILSMYNLAWWHFLLIGLFGSVLGQVGDIFESFLKRRAMIKDSGKLFPGHGGIMDRMDGNIFNAFLSLVAFMLIFLV